MDLCTKYTQTYIQTNPNPAWNQGRSGNDNRIENTKRTTIVIPVESISSKSICRFILFWMNVLYCMFLRGTVLDEVSGLRRGVKTHAYGHSNHSSGV